MGELESRLRGAWQGRVSGCMLGKAVEALSMTSGPEDLTEYLAGVDALPLRDYVPLADEPPPLLFAPCCRERIDASQPDDDINYSVLALTLLEQHGRALTTEDVGRAWLNLLPVGMTFTAERAAYRTLVSEAHEYFALGAPAGVDLARCSDNEFQNWIGAQIRADLYGWVLPGDPSEAARLARVGSCRIAATASTAPSWWRPGVRRFPNRRASSRRSIGRCSRFRATRAPPRRWRSGGKWPRAGTRTATARRSARSGHCRASRFRIAGRRRGRDGFASAWRVRASSRSTRWSNGPWPSASGWPPDRRRMDGGCLLYTSDAADECVKV